MTIAIRAGRTVLLYLLISYAMLAWGNVTCLLVTGHVSNVPVINAWLLPLYTLTHPMNPVAVFTSGSPESITGAYYLQLFIVAAGAALTVAVRHGWIDTYRLTGRTELDKPINKRLRPNLSALGVWTPDGKAPNTLHGWYTRALAKLVPGREPVYRTNGMLACVDGPQPGDRILLGRDKLVHLMWARTYNVYARGEHHVAVYGPSGTGKGASQMNPSMLFWNGSTDNSPDGHGRGWPGPLITSTVKNDHVDVSLEWRASLSDECYVYDPLALYPEYASMWCGWDPLSQIRSFNDASKVAQALMESEQQQASSKSGTDDYFQAQALMVLAPMLLSAAIGNHPFAKVYEWGLLLEAEASNPDVIGQDGTVAPTSAMYAVLDNLYDYAERTGDDIGVNQMQQVFSKDPREASGVWGSIRKALQPYNDETSVRSTNSATMPRMFNPDVFYNTPGATLYIIAPEVASEAKRMRPVFAAFISWLIEQAQQLAREHNGKLPYPVLANLDEVKNVGAIPGLAHTLSLTRSARFFVKHAWQDDAQIESAYGKDDAKTIVSNSRTWVVLPGISDVTHLEGLAKIIGEKTVKKVSHSRRAGSLSNESASESREHLAAANAAAIKELPDGTLLVFSDNMTPFVTRQLRYYEDPTMAARYRLGDERRSRQ